MTSKPHIRKMFPGGVTYQGFYSFYDYMIEPDARHVYVIKGGPGVGKSTFMKQICSEVLEAGYDVELHCCSSDRGSIDGLVIPSLKIALLDGTSPHVVDPKTPGAVDEIINLGDYWDSEVILKSKDDIIECKKMGSREFQAAYFNLKQAKNAMDELEFYVSPYQNWSHINQTYYKAEKEIFKTLPNGLGKVRHLFAWGHTPQGKTQYIDTLIEEMKTLYVLKGQPGTGKSTFLSKILERASMMGIDAEAYHSTLEPEKIDLVILPALGIALVSSSEQYPYIPIFNGDVIEHDFDASLDGEGLKKYQEDIDICRERIAKSIERALIHSSRAKTLHDKMEAFYIPAMRFKDIELKRESVLQEIFSMANDISLAVSTTDTINKEV